MSACSWGGFLLWIGIWLPIAELSAHEQSVADRLCQTLGRGEAECIAVAQSRQWRVVTDDRDARRVAREAGVVVTGTLGALMNLVRGQALPMTEADALLTTMKEHGYRSPVHSLSELESG